MLKRHSAELGSQLAVVTADVDIKIHAQDLGIPIFNNIRQAEKSHWRPERKQRTDLPLTVKRQSVDMWRRRRLPRDLYRLRRAAHPRISRWITHPFTRVFAFTLGVLAVAAIAALLIPSAKIQLSPQTHTDKITISVAASPEFQDVDLSGSIPARPVNIIVEGRSNISTTGSVPIPDQSATGEVIFTNLTERTIPLPVGIVVSTLDDPPVRFQTTKSATVPPGEEGVAVKIEALNPGSSGNTPARSILAIEGPLGLDLTVINRIATRAGRDRQAPAPAETDYQELYNQLFKDLATSALEEIEASLSPDDLLLSKEATHFSTLEEEYSPEEIVPTDQLQLVLRLEFQAMTVAANDLYSLGQSALNANLISGYTTNPNEIEIKHFDKPAIDESGNPAIWRMQAEWQAKAILDTTQAIKLAIGQSPDAAAKNIAEELPLAGSPEIRLFPSWWPRMPFLPFRISVSTSN